MSTLLRIDSSPLGASSISRSLTAEFVKQWEQRHPNGTVITRDLTVSGLTPVDGAWIAAAFTPAANRTTEQSELLNLSDALITELKSADQCVIGVPMHNFTIAANLKLWIDQIARAGETFSYGPQGPVGLLPNNRVTFMVASGGVYGLGSGMESLNFVEPYLRAVLGFLGVTDVQFHVAGGVAQLRTGTVGLEEFLMPHVQSIQAALLPA